MEAVQAFRNWYGNWISNEATEWGEGFGASGDTHAQACGSSINWLITSYILGIRPLKPGYNEVLFDPKPGDIKNAKGVGPSSQRLKKPLTIPMVKGFLL